MRKTFPLESPKLKPARVVEGIKNEFRKYVKRERKKKLPEGVDFCDFECRVGRDEGSAVEVHLEEIAAAVDKAAGEEWGAIYIEIVAKAGYRKQKPKESPTE